EGLSHLVQVARDWPALEAAAAGVVTQATLVSALRGQIDAALLILGEDSSDRIELVDWGHLLSLSQLAALRGEADIFGLSLAIEEAFPSAEEGSFDSEAWQELRADLPEWSEWLASVQE
ncbi:MAG: hypothetical protein ACI841_002107, partial [Planctomycetota bacterium]